MESLITKAKELEKNYEWLQATKLYQKSVEIALKEKDFLKAAKLQENLGFCLYKAAFQAQSNHEYKNQMKQATQAYEKATELLEETAEENYQTRINHTKGMVLFTQSLFETDPSQKKHLLTKWWNLENQVLEDYEQIGDMVSVGKTCNNLVEFSWYDRFFLVSSHSEYSAIYSECVALAEKAITILLKCDDDFELARAYCFASIYYAFSDWILESKEKLEQLNEKCQNYSTKALELAQQTNDAWLIGWSAFAATFANSRIVVSNPRLQMEFCEKTVEYGNIARDNLLIGSGKIMKSSLFLRRARLEEDPNIQTDYCKKALRISREARNACQIIDNINEIYNSLHFYCWALQHLAEFEINPITKKAILERVVKVIEKERERFTGWKFYYNRILVILSGVLWLLAVTSNEIDEKRKLLNKAQFVEKKCLKYLNEMTKTTFSHFARSYNQLSMIQRELANTETTHTEKIKTLNQANASIEKSILFMKRKPKQQLSAASYLDFGQYYYQLGGIQKQFFFITKEQACLRNALKAYKQASANFNTADLATYVAESYWQIAQLYDQSGEFEEASKYYSSTSHEYDLASKKIPQLKDFYREHSLYMHAWEQIEQAKYSHSIEDYESAKHHYEEAANLHKSTSSWSYLAPNYFAWSFLEQAEGFSRKENVQQAVLTFKKAYQEFNKAQESIKQKIAEITSADEKEIIQNLFGASEVRQKYSQVRILMEEAKLLDREGKYQQSSRNYGKAAQKISNVVDKVNQVERKELEYLAILCQAWEKMATAEETSSSEPYFKAAALFEKAKSYSYTQKASLWLLGNSNFCKGLAAGIQYQTGLEKKEHEKAKVFMNTASTNYLKAGFKTASEYAKATQRLFDAYLFMNQAEVEADQEKRSKQYQLAENLLQIAADSFMKAKQPEKTAQVQEILSNVREEKALAVSLSQIMQAPSIAASTQSFSAPSPTSESSVSLEKFEHANVQAKLVTTLKQVKVGESFCLSVEFVNAGREPALLLRVDDFVPRDFIVVKKPEIYRVEESCLNMKGKQLAPLKLVEVKLILQASKRGEYRLNPRVQYLDERGQNKALQLKALEIRVEEIIMEDRVSTGTQELDSLLLGGVPDEYAIVLSSSPCDERERIVKNFLRAGVEAGISFYVTTEASELEDLLDKPNFFLFLCNPKPKVEVPDLPNVFKLQSKTDLTNLGIALIKAQRSIKQSLTNKRICVETLSDVLVKHRENTTREWISGLITDLGAKGFTILTIIDPSMHPSDQANAVINLFDGEISIIQSDDPLDCKKSILVKKLRNQDYIKNPICLR